MGEAHKLGFARRNVGKLEQPLQRPYHMFDSLLTETWLAQALWLMLLPRSAAFPLAFRRKQSAFASYLESHTHL